MASLTIHALSKTFGAVEVIREASLEIADGEFVVFVGPSGCGKSTLLRLIAGLEEASAGDIRIDGVSVVRKAAADRGVAMVFQSYALYPHMTVAENMAFSLKVRKVEKRIIDERVRAAAVALNLTDYLARKPAQLSGGQRQRVAIGRAITRDPAIFLFDEPLSNLDAELRVLMRVETRSAASRFESGSSKRKTLGSRTMARPNATRWRWPPESACGLRVKNGSSPSFPAAPRTRRSISPLATLRRRRPKARLS